MPDITRRTILSALPVAAVASTLGCVRFAEAATWNPKLIVGQARLSGPGTIRYESLYTPGNSLRDVIYKVPLDAAGKPQVLTLPPGLFEIDGFKDGNNNGLRLGAGGATRCRGIAGSGWGTIVRPKTNSATYPATNTGVTVRIEGVANPVFTNFRFEGTPQSVNGEKRYYTGLMVGRCTGAANISWLQMRGASHGYANFPPGETFGISIYRTHNCEIHDIDIDGRDNAGNRVCASPFGWNGGGMTDPVLNARVRRVFAHHAIAGMPTFWQTKGIDTADLWSISNGTGTGKLSGHAINHEQSWGKIRHLRPHLITNGFGSPDPTHTANNGMHFSAMNSVHDMGLDFIMTEPTWDKAYGPTGMLIMGGYDGYTGGIAGATSQLRTAPRVIKNGITLGHTDHPKSGWSSADPAKFYAWVH